MSHNVRSLRNKVPEVMSYLIDHNIDCLCVQETWLRRCDSDINKEIKEFGYKVMTFRKLDWGGGVAILVRNNIKCNHIKSDGMRTFEYVQTKVFTDTDIIHIINIYRAEYSMKHRVTVKQFLEEFSNFLEDLSSFSHPVIIVGDFNLHIELMTEVYQLTEESKSKMHAIL